MKALYTQLENALQHLKNQKIQTVFIGGGTPSCIEALEYEKLFALLQSYLKNDAEITIEANPNSATPSWLQAMFEYGVNRISFGVQSFNDEKLRFLGRSHNQSKAITAIELAQKVGFKKINTDLIYGVYNDTIELLKKDISLLKQLDISHVSAYSLTLEEHTPFYGKNSVKIDDETLSIELFEALEDIGLKQYEISNFAQHKSLQSQHNLGYWQHKEYLGIGAGAVGYGNQKRFYTHKDVQAYIQNPYFYETETLSLEDIKTEKVLLGFRSIVGVPKNLFNANELQKVEFLIKNNQLFEENRIFFNPNFLLADELALYILE